jgi:predicted GIY-YIG superfamily endonuclease
MKEIVLNGFSLYQRVLSKKGMKEEIRDLLHTYHILPITNERWTEFEVNLSTTSTEQEVSEAKKKIRERISEGIGGVYIISKEEAILYIGESKHGIRRRIMRHMDKITIRTDRRSEFFKLEQHQGFLTVRFMPLPKEQIRMRRAIEEMLTMLLEPEYKKWELRNKIIELESTFTGEKRVN